MPPEGPQRLERRPEGRLLSIQYLRAVAALTVVTTHALHNKVVIIGLFAGLAVDLFFLISGFLFVALLKEDARPSTFLLDRIARIVPIYWFVTLLTFGFFYSGILSGEWRPWIWAGHLFMGDWALLFKSLFFIPTFSPMTNDILPLVPQGWTLNFEMEFYFLFALALFASRRWIVPGLTALFVAMVILGDRVEGGTAFEIWTHPIIALFVFGMWVGLAWRRGWRFRWVYPAMLVGWLVWSAYVVNTFLGDIFGPERIIFLPILLAFLMSSIWLEECKGMLRDWRFFRLLGDASYSIYLFHFVPIFLTDTFLDQMETKPVVSFMLIFVPGVVGGLITYWTIERPIMRWYKRNKQHFHQRVASLLGGRLQPE